MAAEIDEGQIGRVIDDTDPATVAGVLAAIEEGAALLCDLLVVIEHERPGLLPATLGLYSARCVGIVAAFRAEHPEHFFPIQPRSAK